MTVFSSGTLFQTYEAPVEAPVAPTVVQLSTLPTSGLRAHRRKPAMDPADQVYMARAYSAISGIAQAAEDMKTVSFTILHQLSKLFDNKETLDSNGANALFKNTKNIYVHHSPMANIDLLLNYGHHGHRLEWNKWHNATQVVLEWSVVDGVSNRYVYQQRACWVVFT